MEPGVTVTRLRVDDLDERFQRVRAELGVSTLGLNLIRLAPGQRGRIHRHERQEEVYVVLAGELTLLLEGEPRTIARWEAVRVAPDVRRQLANRGREPLLLLALGGAERHAGRDGLAFADWADTEGRPPQQIPLPTDDPSA
jgi:mannose-6-phosphate isomerase-like protein (cupin superfamily)